MDFSSPNPRGGHPSVGPTAAADLPPIVHIRREEFARMRSEMQLVRRKFKYIQGVSTVFRQKIAFILRELAAAPARGTYVSVSDMAAAYSAALRELGTLGTELSTSVLGRDEAILGKGPAVPIAASPSPTPHAAAGGQGDAVSFKELLDRMDVLQQGALGAEGVEGADALANGIPTNRQPLEDRAAEWARNAQARDDIRKAHHLCVLLDEKNNAKAAAEASEQRAARLAEQYSGLSDKYQRLVTLLQQRGSAVVGGGAAAAAAQFAVERELYEQRIAALEDALVAAKTEMGTNTLRGHTNNNNSSNTNNKGKSGGSNKMVAGALVTRASDELADPSLAAAGGGGILAITNTTDVGVLQRQNAVLRARVRSLRQGADALGARGGGAVEEMQKGMDDLLGRIRSLQTEVAARSGDVERLTAERADAEAAAAEAKARVSAYVDQLANVSAEYQSLAAAYNSLRATASSETRELALVVAEYTEMVSARDGAIKGLKGELDEAYRAASEREVTTSVLGAQIESLRSRIETMTAAEDAQRLQRTSLEDMGDRMVAALSDVQTLYASGSISGQLEALTLRLADLEGMEAQARLKDDHIAVLQDECDRLRASHEELSRSLRSVTTLFSSMPRSAGEVEALVVELEESRAEIALSARAHAPPNAARLAQRIELRLMEARHAKKGALVATGQGQGQRNGEGQAAPQRRPMPLPAAAVGAVEEVPPIDASLLAIPPPPALVDITNALPAAKSHKEAPKAQHAERRPSSAMPPLAVGGPSSSAGPSRSVSTASKPLPPPASNGGGGEGQRSLPDSGLVADIHMTFDLFAEAGVGGAMAMTEDGLAMAYSTLGIAGPAKLSAADRAMGRDAFVSHCVGLLGQ